MATAARRKRLQCKPKIPQDLLVKAVELLEHPMTQGTPSRQLSTVNEFIDLTPDSFWLHDIPHIIRLYEALAKRANEGPEFKEPLRKILELSAVAPKRAKVSSKNEFERDFRQYFTTLGYLIACLQDPDLSKLAVAVIKKLLLKSPSGINQVDLEFCVDSAEKSGLPGILAQLLEVVSEEVYPDLVDVSTLLCELSRRAAQKMVEEGAIEHLLLRLDPKWTVRDANLRPEDPTPEQMIKNLDEITKLIWLMINSLDECTKFEVPTVSALWSLQHALRWTLITKGHRVNRNNLVGIVLRFLQIFPHFGFAASGLAHDIGILASSGSQDKGSLIQLTPDDEDFQLLKFVLLCIPDFALHDSKELLQEYKVMTSLVDLLSKDKQIKWHREHHCELMILSLRIIPKVLSHTLKDFLSVDGPWEIIKLLENYLKEAYDRNVLAACLFCLSGVLLLDIEKVVQSVKALQNVNICNIVLLVCKEILETKCLTAMYQQCLGRGFCILQSLYKIGFEAKFLTMNVCTDYLKRVISPTEDDPLLDVKITICGLHLLWESVLSQQQLLDKFLFQGGIYLLLDVTHASPFPVKAMTLGILADVCRRAACVPYMITWRKRCQKLIPMLLEIFRGQTEVQCRSLERRDFVPSVKENQWLGLCHQKQTNLDVSKAQLLEYCRPKILAILEALKVRFRDKVEVADEHYRLFNEPLTTDDQLTMLFAENFSSLKMCETWINVAKALREEGVTPTGDDLEHLADKVKRIRTWKHFLQQTVENIIKHETKRLKWKELKSYNALKEARLSDALDALMELRYNSNCTERMFQVRKKIRQSNEVDSPLINTEPNFHRTICNLPFTNIYNQCVSIKSDVILNNEKEFHLSLVSLDSEGPLGSNRTRSSEFVNEDPPIC